ncbi:MAG TPA: KGG domain-containing protein [Verrucomicrobiae bacterium]|nr:KGG domain-containing protein [Verrucomicrobiae bacterium]
MRTTRSRRNDEGAARDRDGRGGRFASEEGEGRGWLRGGRRALRGGRGWYEKEYETPRSRRRYEAGEVKYGTRSRRVSSRRGFAAMDPERQREIAAEGGRAPHRGPRGFAAMAEDEQREIASEGGRAPHRGPRGFAAMNPAEQREIASEGGRAPHRGPRGFAAMDRAQQREIASRGGHASRGRYGRKYEGEKEFEPSSSRRGSHHRRFAAVDRKNAVKSRRAAGALAATTRSGGKRR